jgi:hypothetical protein
MKLKIFLIWLVAIFTSPLYMNIPVIGNWMLGIFVLGPVALWFLRWFIFAPASASELSGYSHWDIQKAREEGRQQGYNNGYNNGRNS